MTYEHKLPANDLHLFAEAVGLDRKKFRQAAEMIGLTQRQFQGRSAGTTPLTKTERLAMTAAVLDLPEFPSAIPHLSPDQKALMDAYADVLRKIIAGIPSAIVEETSPEATEAAT